MTFWIGVIVGFNVGAAVGCLVFARTIGHQAYLRGRTSMARECLRTLDGAPAIPPPIPSVDVE